MAHDRTDVRGQADRDHRREAAAVPTSGRAEPSSRDPQRHGDQMVLASRGGLSAGGDAARATGAAGDSAKRQAPRPWWRRTWLWLLVLAVVGVAAYWWWPRPDAPASVSVDGRVSSPTRVDNDPARALEEALAAARRSLETLQGIADYTATFVKQERVGGRLLEQETAVLKVRQEPFSVYLRHTAPAAREGQEALYIAGRNGGKLLAHGVGIEKLLGTLRLDPQGFLAMRDNRHPITQIGMKNLLHELLKLSETQRDNILQCDIRIHEDVSVDQRPCRCLELRSPRPLPGFPLAIARIYLDRQWNIPVRYEAYEWKDDSGREYHLVEFYEYRDIRLNVGLSDADFDPSHPEYGF
jgi:hypothetical protein